ncbi:MAG: NADH-quinone oxidoreductase subunit NuoK [Coriobacteriia bacterium]|nr:NADH-quinone oxidoreductase subunit NuoK [Coriobacteriia bacterium]
MIVAIGCAAAFSLGVYAVLTRRDVIAILAGAELMLGAANVQLVAFALSRGGDGAVVSSFALIVLVIAAAEAAVGMALVVTAYRRTRRTLIDEFGEVSG